MKVEELYKQETQSQVGVTLQRRPFETEVDIVPQLSPFGESVTSADEAVMTELTGAQTEERLSRAAKHQPDDDFQGMPLKRIDSGPHQHRLQSCRLAGEPVVVPSTPRHEELLAQIDAPEEPQPAKRESTLTRMLKGVRGDKDDKTLTRILHRMNPVSKTSRESLSKVFHRIGDALQKRGEDRSCSPGRGQKREGRVDVSKSSGPAKIGEKMFKCRPSDSETDKAT